MLSQFGDNAIVIFSELKLSSIAAREL